MSDTLDERTLLAAVIEQAIADLRFALTGRSRSHPPSPVDYATAIWFLLDDDSPLPRICETLGVDVDAVRAVARDLARQVLEFADRRRTLAKVPAKLHSWRGRNYEAAEGLPPDFGRRVVRLVEDVA